MDNLATSVEISKPPTGRRGRAKAFQQESHFFEKITNSMTSLQDANENNHFMRQSPQEHSQSPAPLTHRSANFLSTPPPVKPRTKIYEQTKLDDELIQSSPNSSRDFFLRGVFTLDAKTVDLELTKSTLKWKCVNGI